MSDDVQTAPSERSMTLDLITAQLTRHELSGLPLQRQLGELAAAGGIGLFFGTIAFAGRTYNGDYNVQFNDENSNVGYSSVWPEWAFAMARDALMGGKKVLVLAIGDPYGNNLVQILVFA
jgi:hypothetical protein